jgi:protein gp37
VLLDPLRWKRPRKIFVCAHGDLFHESVPDEWIDRVFAVMALAPQHVFQVLTKRPERMREYMSARGHDYMRDRASATCNKWRARRKSSLNEDTGGIRR